MDTKKLLLSSVAVGAAASSAILVKQEKRQQLMNKFNSLRNKWFGKSEGFPIEKAASPEPYETENNKMLDEGSTYGVQYYDEEKRSKE